MAIGHGEAEASAAIFAALRSGETKILLDLGGVPLIDSSGIGELVSVFTVANNSNAALKLPNLSCQVEEVMKSTLLTGVFDIFDDEAAAIASFG